jgi:hypothetical protein
MTDAEMGEFKIKKDRSPSFPFIPLDKAIWRLEAFAEHHKRSAARLVAVAPTWGYAIKSSGLLQTIAALKSFGLLEDMGSGEERKIKISELGWKILFDARPGERERAVAEAALRPRLIAEYANEWLPGRPSDAHCISELHIDRGFTPEAAKVFLRVFDETVSFANLKATDRVSDVTPEDQLEPTMPSVHDSPAPLPALAPAQPRRVVWTVGGGEQSPGVANRATFPLPEGMVALELPRGSLSKESYEDLKAWLEVMLRRAERSATTEQKPQVPDQQEEEQR